ncbi:MAG TPA: tryptophanase [Bacillota bacterium]
MGPTFEPEPYRIKVVEPIRKTTIEERVRIVREAGYNLFAVPSEDVFIDLLTDSGTSAMSDRQWAGLMAGDEAYAGSRNFYSLRDTVRRVMGFPYVIPTHQGRAAEHVLFATMVKPGQAVVNNMHFDTTKAHVEHRGARAVNLAIDAVYDPVAHHPFKGDMDLKKLDKFLASKVGPDGTARADVPMVMVTITCNSGGGQPVSLNNLRGVREIADRYGVPVFLDAARFAENAFFIKEREPGQHDRSIPEIVKEMFSYADGCTMSAKKDALVNIGGFVALRSEETYHLCSVWAILFEGFVTYGGLAGRDLEAMARGLDEVLDEEYLKARIGQVRYLGQKLIDAGVPIIEPIGGHAVYLDAKRFLPHLHQDHFPAQALSVELYVEGGVRTVEIGTVLEGRDPATHENIYPALEMVRLAIPRRVYTQSHLDYVAEVVKRVHARRESIRGLRFTYEPPVLRHFTARFEPV